MCCGSIQGLAQNENYRERTKRISNIYDPMALGKAEGPTKEKCSPLKRAVSSGGRILDKDRSHTNVPILDLAWVYNSPHLLNINKPHQH